MKMKRGKEGTLLFGVMVMGNYKTMNTAKCRSLTIKIFMAVGICILLICSDIAFSQENAVLLNTDCVKCHPRQVNDIAAAGGAHMSVSCAGCHEGHPPSVAKPIPLCGQCHLKSKNDHFDGEMPSCLKCHTNPHRPLNISLKGAGKDACRMCHGPESWMLSEYKSKHSALDCSRCHDVHRKIPQCTQCHRPHWDGMTSVDCKKCHKAHMPRVTAFSSDMHSKDCGLCHKRPANLLSATTSKHGNLACVGCHKLMHKFKPACSDCHGTPHPKGILVKFPECDMCHKNAHDLNNWPRTSTANVAGEASKRQE
jgi:hypothetical protein